VLFGKGVIVFSPKKYWDTCSATTPCRFAAKLVRIAKLCCDANVTK
jgi:hypothetical protein